MKKWIRFFGWLILIGGIALLGVSFYIQGQVSEGREKITNAKEKVKTGDSLFSLTPPTEVVGKVLKKPITDEISKGERMADSYADLASKFKVGGIVLIVVGVAAGFILRRW